jgi:hypothetical protein
MNELQESLRSALLLGLVIGAAALLGTLAARRRARACVGRVVCAQHPRSFASLLRWVCALAALVVLALNWRASGDNALPTAALLGVVFALLAATPSPERQLCGESGVARGLDGRRFEQLEEWRLAGDHLRWKLDGEWTACHAPAPLHADLRAKLVQACPERESRFS